jgi:hypothetical protein
MALYIVTVKLAKNSDHNPLDKRTGECPLPSSVICTDVTGEHHSLLVEAASHDAAREVATRHGYFHVTRVESIGLPLS